MCCVLCVYITCPLGARAGVGGLEGESGGVSLGLLGDTKLCVASLKLCAFVFCAPAY
jgi:hypothetical protein